MFKILILYSELADYSVACFRALSQQKCDIQLIHWPVNPEAPFQFDLSFVKEACIRADLDDQALMKRVEAFKPDLILCSGWMDKAYMKICKQHKNRIPVVLSMDNHWNGSLKQQIARILAPFFIQTRFNKAFVPGEIQKRFALKLGFKQNDVKTGFYAADVEKFIQPADALNSKASTLKKRFFYLGRYVRHKGIFDLWEAYQIYRNKGGDWELWCAGTGDQFENRVEEQGIKHFGFVQPQDIPGMLPDVHAYILPSHFEPWGVSVQEMAAAGLPLILSNQIGSKEIFLQDGVNGFSYHSGKVNELANAMLLMSELSEAQWIAMSMKSTELGRLITPNTWSQQLLSFIQ